MTTQSPDIFGRDIYLDPVTEDATDDFAEVTGVPLVKQDLRHRLTVASVLGPDGDSDGFFDLHKLLGMAASAAESYKSRIKRVALKDQRIRSADVTISETTSPASLTALVVTVDCKTALGPFRLAFLLNPASTTASQVQIIEAQ